MLLWRLAVMWSMLQQVCCEQVQASMCYRMRKLWSCFASGSMTTPAVLGRCPVAYLPCRCALSPPCCCARLCCDASGTVDSICFMISSADWTFLPV
jgi:hypothetical protein